MVRVFDTVPAIALVLRPQRTVLGRLVRLGHRFRKNELLVLVFTFVLVGWNEIGVPMLLGEILVLLDPDPADLHLAPSLEILKRSKWTKWTGQNLVWGCSIQILRGILEHNDQTIAEGYRRMYDEVNVTLDDGIQHDDSFHQHGRQLYNGGYGLNYASDIGRYIAFTAGTPWQIPREKLEVFVIYLLDGQAWMTWDNLFDYSAVGREIVRPGKNAVPKLWNAAGPIAPAGSSYSMLNSVHLLAELPNIPRGDELRAFESRLHQQPGAPAKSGNKQFWRSDYMTHRRPGWFVSVKMLSERMLGAELVNDEGKKSHHLSDGATLIYRSGDEYRDIFPAWDWRKIPGTTAEQFDLQTDRKEIAAPGKTGFVGGVSDGTYGLAFMDLARRNLTAHKAWFFFDQEFVALGAGISNTTDISVITTVNQSLLRGQLTRDSIPGAPFRWLHHDGIGYIFPVPPKPAPTTNSVKENPARLTLSTEVQSGNWTDLAPQPDRVVTVKVFNLYLDHGPHPTSATYSYFVLPNSAPDDVARWAQKPPIEILSNTPDLQAVRHKTLKITMAAFPKPGRLPAAGDSPAIEVDQPCLLMLHDNKLTVSNPTNKPLVVSVKINTQTYPVKLPDMPLAGSSVTIPLPP